MGAMPLDCFSFFFLKHDRRRCGRTVKRDGCSQTHNHLRAKLYRNCIFSATFDEKAWRVMALESCRVVQSPVRYQMPRGALPNEIIRYERHPPRYKK